MAKKKVLGFLDKPIEKVNEFIDPNLRKLREAKEQQQFMQNTNAEQQQRQDIKLPEIAGTKQSNPVIIRDTDTGRVTGVEMPDGRIIQGLNPTEVGFLVNKFNERMATPEGAVEGSAVAQQRNLTEQNLALAQEVGQPTNINPNDLAVPADFNTDVWQAVKTGAVSSIPGVIGAALGAAGKGLGVGAAAGGGVLSPLTATIGAGLFAVNSFIRSAQGNIKAQATDNIRAYGKSLTTRERYLGALVSDTNQNPQNAARNLELFNYQLALINQERANLKSAIMDGAKFGEDATMEQAKYNLFFSAGGSGEVLQRRMQVAILNPNPNDLGLLSADDIAQASDI